MLVVLVISSRWPREGAGLGHLTCPSQGMDHSAWLGKCLTLKASVCTHDILQQPSPRGPVPVVGPLSIVCHSSTAASLRGAFVVPIVAAHSAIVS
jgi:hypothetical protein